MTTIERTAYPRLKPDPSAAELAEVWSPKPEDVELGRTATRGEGQLLGFMLMLGCLRRLGYFPGPGAVPEAVVSHIRSRLGLSQEAAPVLPERSLYRYQATIREHLGVEAAGDRARHLAARTMSEATLTMDDPADLFNAAIEELVRERFELPAFTTLDRMARHVRRTVNARMFARVGEGLTEAGGQGHLLESPCAGDRCAAPVLPARTRRRHSSMGSASLTTLPVRTSSTPDHVRRGPGRKSAVRKSREYNGSEKG